MILLPQGTNKINADHIERNIGISKEYNNFELTKALGQKNVLKANRIIRYMGDNQKTHPMVLTMTILYGYFSKLMAYHFITDKSRNNVASMLGIKPFGVTEYELAAKKYTPAKLAQIISYLKEYDLKSKGIGGSSATEGEMLSELIYKILH